MYPTILSKHQSKAAGIAGEKRVETIFRNHSFPTENRIFHDLSLKTSTTFQLDHVFFSQAFSLVFETKNISGVLTFKENPPQLIREKFTGEIDSFNCPAAQVEQNVELMKDWLHQRNIHIPVIGIVVIAYPKQIIKVSPKNIKVLFPNMIPLYIRGLLHLPNKIDIHTLNLLTDELLNSHQEYIPKPISESFSISKEDFKTGVICPTCGYIGMIKIPRTWHCPKCKNNDPLAYKQAVLDWFLLMGREMSNQDCREFLHIDDRNVATRIFKSMNLKSTGTFKDRRYQIDFSKHIKD